jgi:hypothetical protein
LFDVENEELTSAFFNLLPDLSRIFPLNPEKLGTQAYTHGQQAFVSGELDIISSMFYGGSA